MTAHRSEIASLGAGDWIGIMLVVITGIIHLVVLGAGLVEADASALLRITWVVAGVGFFGAIIFLTFDYRRRLIYLIGIPYTGIQVVIYYALDQPTLSSIESVPLLDKTVQIILILVLIVLLVQRR